MTGTSFINQSHKNPRKIPPWPFPTTQEETNAKLTEPVHRQEQQKPQRSTTQRTLLNKKNRTFFSKIVFQINLSDSAGFQLKIHRLCYFILLVMLRPCDGSKLQQTSGGNKRSSKSCKRMPRRRSSSSGTCCRLSTTRQQSEQTSTNEHPPVDR